jgi:hypothetical protein
VYERRWFLALRLDNSDGGRLWLDIGGRVGVLRSLSNTGSWPHSGCAVRSTDRSQHVRLRPLTASLWLFQRAALRGSPTRRMTADRVGFRWCGWTGMRSYFEGGRRSDADRPRHWRYLTVEHPDHGTAHQALGVLVSGGDAGVVDLPLRVG